MTCFRCKSKDVIESKLTYRRCAKCNVVLGYDELAPQLYIDTNKIMEIVDGEIDIYEIAALSNDKTTVVSALKVLRLKIQQAMEENNGAI
jgi:hypothetical protein